MNSTVEIKQADAVRIAALSATAHDASPQSTGHVLRDLFGQVIERMEAVKADRTTPFTKARCPESRALTRNLPAGPRPTATTTSWSHPGGAITSSKRTATRPTGSSNSNWS